MEPPQADRPVHRARSGIGAAVPPGGMGAAASLLAWITTWLLVAAGAPHQAVALATLVATVVVVGRYRHLGRPPLVDVATLVAMVSITTVAFTVDRSWLGTWLPLVVDVALVIVLVVARLADRPFPTAGPAARWWIGAGVAMAAGAAVSALAAEGVIPASPEATVQVRLWATWGITAVALTVAVTRTPSVG